MNLPRHTPTTSIATAIVALATASALGCTQAMPREGTDRPDSGTTPTPETGVCCPVTHFRGCSPGNTPLPAGGWAPRPELCTATIGGRDGRPYGAATDAHGCTVIVETDGCCGCPAPPPEPDAGTVLPPEPDAGPPPATSCLGLGPAACFASRGCAPSFDDACCSSCHSGEGCADCTDIGYAGCVPLSESRCPVGSAITCGFTPSWGCGPAAATCDGAYVVDLDSCDRLGCVPAYPPGEGAPTIESAVCVPITGDSCTASCRLDPGPCPTGTVPEATGSCYSGRCIPAFVCD